LQAARFVSILCAVAHQHDHYPQVHLQRQLVTTPTKQWLVTTTVTCHTTLLQGLSYHDFHIATVCVFYNMIYVVIILPLLLVCWLPATTTLF
jgi:pterin-4a-carbinolamine dehydratase